MGSFFPPPHTQRLLVIQWLVCAKHWITREENLGYEIYMEFAVSEHRLYLLQAQCQFRLSELAIKHGGESARLFVCMWRLPNTR